MSHRCELYFSSLLRLLFPGNWIPASVHKASTACARIHGNLSKWHPYILLPLSLIPAPAVSKLGGTTSKCTWAQETQGRYHIVHMYLHGNCGNHARMWWSWCDYWSGGYWNEFYAFRGCGGTERHQDWDSCGLGTQIHQHMYSSVHRNGHSLRIRNWQWRCLWGGCMILRMKNGRPGNRHGGGIRWLVRGSEGEDTDVQLEG